MKVALDDRSLDYVRDHLERVEDPLLRQLIWQALWNMVRDQQLKSTDYLPLAASKVAGETDIELVETVLASVTGTIARFVPDDRRDEGGAPLLRPRVGRALRGRPGRIDGRRPDHLGAHADRAGDYARGYRARHRAR